MRLLLRLLAGVLVVWLAAAVAGVPLARDLARGAGDGAEGIARRLDPPAPTLSQSPAPSPRREPPPPLRSLPGRRAGPAASPPADTPDAVRSALSSVVQILVSSCGEDGAGSGFVAGRDRVVTAAHVVTGASRVVVLTQSGARLAARVVLYEPAADTAVLAVAGLAADPLRFAPAEADTGSSAWVAGHPLGGPLRVVDASVVGTVGARGSDGETYVLRTVVRPGNSGGPLLDAQGRVLGVVYATAADGDPEGYARTWPAVEDEVTRGTRATATVPTGAADLLPFLYRGRRVRCCGLDDSAVHDRRRPDGARPGRGRRGTRLGAAVAAGGGRRPGLVAVRRPALELVAADSRGHGGDRRCRLARRPGDGAGIAVPIAAQQEVLPVLVDLLERRAAELGLQRLQVVVLVPDPPVAGLLADRGYRDVRHFFEMAIELDGPPSVPGLPEGCTLHVATPEDGRAFHAVITEAFEDHWDHQSMPFDEWWPLRTGDPDFDISWWFLVRDGDEPVAAMRNVPGRNGGVYVASLGVRRGWRGRGLAKALLLHTFARAYAAGSPRITLGVDAISPTGATALYRSVGMTTELESAVWEKRGVSDPAGTRRLR